MVSINKSIQNESVLDKITKDYHLIVRVLSNKNNEPKHRNVAYNLIERFEKKYEFVNKLHFAFDFMQLRESMLKDLVCTYREAFSKHDSAETL